MKARMKFELALAAGMSDRTFSRWIQSHREALKQLGVVIKKLFRLGEALNTSRKGLKAEKLERIAREILWQAPEHTMQNLDHFFTRCKHGHYGNFSKGLLMTDIMRAWRKSEEITNYKLCSTKKI